MNMLCSILCIAVYCEILKAGDTQLREKNSTAVLCDFVSASDLEETDV